MIEQKFGPRRCRDTRKPLASQCPDVTFYCCMECGALFPVTGGKESGDREILCCGKKALRLIPKEAEDPGELQVTYQITGGYNDNAVRVSWKYASLKGSSRMDLSENLYRRVLKICDIRKTPAGGFRIGRHGCFCLLR